MTRLTARYVTALVFAFSAAGVFHAQSTDKETIAGPSKVLEDPDGCPADYPIAKPATPGNKGDGNGDGIVCTDAEGIVVVDNDADSPSPATRHVSGHGNFIDGGKEIPLQDISFSFHGIGINGAGDQAKGKFEYHDQTGSGPDLTVHGEVLCLSVNANVATLLGVVTRSNDLELPVNALVTWRTVDNGEGNNALPDTLSRPSPVNEKAMGDCKFKLIKFRMLDIISGNIQVHEDETSSDVPTSLEDKTPEDRGSDSWGVNGHGNFFDVGKKVVQDISFSFHAIGESADGKFIDDVAKGEFEYHDQTPGGPDLMVHGSVVCASVNSNSVTLIGVVTRSNDKGLPVDTLVAWGAQDNGEGLDAAPDMVSRLAPIGVKMPKAICSGKIPAPKLQPVLNGNIQVR